MIIFTKKIKTTLWASFILLSTINSHAQDKPITVSLQNEMLEKAFDQIEAQTPFRFLFNKDLVPVNQRLSRHLTESSIATLLTKLFARTGIGYRITNRQIVLSNLSALETEQDKRITLSGHITDEQGNLLPGVSIRVKDTPYVTVSDVNGNFSLQALPHAVLIFSYTGFVTQEIPYPQIKNQSVILNEDHKQLDEVVVVGYGTTKRKDLTTAISSVKTDEIPQAANSHVQQLLLGRAAGLQATVVSPQPGGNVNISIRGAGTPIYVVDGVMMPSDALEVGSGRTGVPNAVNRAGLAGLDPSDIESVEILKDASAAIYGIGAANGVILITTKKGKLGKPTLSYEGSTSLVYNYPYLDLLNANDYMNLANVFNKENYLYNKKQYPYGNTPYDNAWTPLFSNEQIAATQTHNWKDDIFKTGHIQNQKVTINGGTDALRYYLGGSYFKNDGSVTNAGMDRFALRTQVSSQLMDFLKLSAIVNLNQNNYLNSSVGSDTGNQGDHGSGALQSALAYPPYLPLYDVDGKYSLYKNFPNPAAMLEINDRTKTNGFYTNFSLDADIIKHTLTAKLRYGYNRDNSDRGVFIPSDVYFGQMYKPRGSVGYSKRAHSTMEATLSYNKQVTQDIHVDAVLGIGRYKENFQGLDVSYENINDQINNDNIGAADGPFYPTSFRGENEKRSQFGRVNIDLFDRYVIGGTLRRDGTDKFFPDKKYAWFPSVSAAWKITNESFLPAGNVLHALKLRASYGQTGNDNLGTALYGLFSPSENQIKFSGNSVSYIPYLMIGADYPDVTWEKTTMKNVGIDFSLFHDRITGNFDVFRNDITNLLGQAPTSPLGMLGTRPINGGHYKRYGWDAALNTLNIESTHSGFRWNSQFTFSRFNMVWLERMPNYDYAVYQQRNNEPVNAYYYYTVDGIINADRSNMPESQKTLPSDAQQPGYMIIRDIDGDGRITVGDISMDNTVPQLYYGFGNDFSYKNFDFHIFFYGQLGVHKYNYAYAWVSAFELSTVNPANSNTYAFNLWNSQTNPAGTLPGIASSKGISLPGDAGTNLNVQDASFIRCRNITFGYTWNRTALKSWGKHISQIRLFADLQNPFALTRFDGFDPEINTGGNSTKGKAEYPQIRTYSFGLSASF